MTSSAGNVAHRWPTWPCPSVASSAARPATRTCTCASCAGSSTAPIRSNAASPTVEEVRDKEHANFCDHYKPVAGAFKGGSSAAADAAKSELEKLFGKG